MKNKLKLLIIPAVALLLCGCNKDIFDTNYTYHKAICEIGGETKEIEIRQWRDYDGEQIQIIGRDGKTYLVSTNNCTLIKE